MLAEFQRALADLTASPELCRAVRRRPAVLDGRYALTARERGRLEAIVASRGMEANCMMYRANRLAPLALNIPDTCEAVRADLEALLCAYWASEPTTDVNFLVETDRFCRFLAGRPGLPEATAGPRARRRGRQAGGQPCAGRPSRRRRLRRAAGDRPVHLSRSWACGPPGRRPLPTARG